MNRSPVNLGPKIAAAENGRIWSAFQQHQTFRGELPALFAPNALPAVSGGMEARIGTPGAGQEWFKPWCMIAGDTLTKVQVSGLPGARR